jgi:hypothetical protein
MTEPEWLACADPEQMRIFVSATASKRRLRLVGCACCRRIWMLLSDEQTKRAVEGAELFADGLLPEKSLQQLSSAAQTLWEKIDYENERARAGRAAAATYVSSLHFDLNVLSNTMGAVAESRMRRQAAECRAQAAVLREVCGNPFRNASPEKSWLTRTVISLAQVIYDERAFDRLPILADALEDAGCTNADILEHCRKPGEHCRGCWAVDLLLGKE